MSATLIPVAYHSIASVDGYGGGRVQLRLMTPSTFNDSDGGYCPAESVTVQLRSGQALALLNALQAAMDYKPEED